MLPGWSKCWPAGLDGISTRTSRAMAPRKGTRPISAAAVMMLMTMLMEMDTRAHHQYSLRLALPEKTVYFFQKRFTAAAKGAPLYGAQSGGSAACLRLLMLRITQGVPPGVRVMRRAHRTGAAG